jgi:hypothetical protein
LRNKISLNLLRQRNKRPRSGKKSNLWLGLIDTLRVSKVQESQVVEEKVVMRKFVSMVAATAFLASTVAAFADGTQTASTPAQPLAPGGAAGVHNAELFGLGPAGLWIAGGAIALGVGTAIVLSNHSSSTPSTTH